MLNKCKKITFLFLSFTISFFSYADSVTVTGVTNDSDSWSDDIWFAEVNFTCDKQTVNTSSLSSTDAISCAAWSQIRGQNKTITFGNCPYTKTYGYDTTTYPGCNGNGLIVINEGGVLPEWDDTTRVCVGIAKTQGGMDVREGDILTASPNCVTVPPPPNVLSCHTLDVMIDYGNVPPSAFSGGTKGKKSVYGGVTCTGGDATVKITFSPSVFPLSNGGDASLNFADGAESTIVDVKANVEMQYPIQSELSSSTPVDIGPFTGSTTVIAEMQ